MRNIIKRLVFIIIIIILNLISIYSEEMNIRSIDNILSDIRGEQGLKDVDKINPDKVNSQLLEKLGDAVMEEMTGNHDRHEQIDQMMGGEGSANLTAMYQRIGYNYLAGNINGYQDMMKYSGMMNEYPAKTSNNFKGEFPMMWNRYEMMNGFGWIGYLIEIIILIMTGIAIFFVVKLVLKKNNNSQKIKFPINILKNRYVKGEISRKEYELMKKDIERS